MAARVAAEDRRVLGVALIAPWDISYDARAWKALSANQRATTATEAFDDVDGRLSGATAGSLMDELLREGPALNLTALGAALSAYRVLLVTATHDDPDDQATGLKAVIARHRHGTFEAHVMATDHAFNDPRIALETAMLNWLSRLPGAP